MTAPTFSNVALRCVHAKPEELKELGWFVRQENIYKGLLLPLRLRFLSSRDKNDLLSLSSIPNTKSYNLNECILSLEGNNHSS